MRLFQGKTIDRTSDRGMLITILALAWPTMLEQFMQTAVQYIDTAMAGTLGTQATAAKRAVAQAVLLTCVLGVFFHGADSGIKRHDTVEICDMLKKFLAMEGYEVEAAYDGESACKMFFEDGYALVLLDLMIPKIDGMEVMNVIRANSPPPVEILQSFSAKF